MKHTLKQAPSSWLVILILFFITSAIESMTMSHVFAFMPIYLISLHVAHTKTWVGILSAVTFVVGLPFVPLWGIWAKRYGGKPVIIRSAYVEMFVFILLSFSHSLLGIFVAMMLVGFQLGNTGIMLAALRHAAPENKVGFAVSIFSVASSVGSAGGPLLGGLLVGTHWLNLHGLYLIDGVLSFLAGTMLLLGYREDRIVIPSLTNENTTSVWHEAWQSITFTFSLSITWILFGLFSTMMVARQMVSPYLPLMIAQLSFFHLPTSSLIGDLMGLSAVVGAIITIYAGRLGDRVGFIRIMTITFFILIPSVVLLGITHQILLFTLALTVFSAGYSIVSAMIFALFSTKIPISHRSTAMNLIYLPLYIGGIIGPAIASFLVSFSITLPFVAASISFLIALLLIATQRSRLQQANGS